MAVTAPGSPRGHPRAAVGGWRWHLCGDTRPGDGHRAGVARTPALGDCWHGGGPCKEPPARPEGCRGCPHAMGSSSTGGSWCGQGSGGQGRAGTWEQGWRAPSSSHLGLFLLILLCSFSSSLTSSSSSPLHAILVSLLLSSSQISLSSSFGLPPASLAFSSSRPSHPSHHLLDLPLFSASCHHLLSHFLFSCHLLSTAEMARGHAVCHHNPYFRARGITLPSPAPSWPQHCPQLVLMSPGWDRAVSPAQATVAPTPVALHVLPSQ